MANHKSAEKRLRRDTKRRDLNHQRISRVRTFLKRAEKAVASGDKVLAQGEFKMAVSESMKSVTKGVMHKNTVARKISRLSAKVKALA
jgi:small subunit ribosomal protein S20